MRTKSAGDFAGSENNVGAAAGASRRGSGRGARALAYAAAVEACSTCRAYRFLRTKRW